MDGCKLLGSVQQSKFCILWGENITHAGREPTDQTLGSWMTNGILLLTQMVRVSRVRTPGTLPFPACAGSFTTCLGFLLTCMDNFPMCMQALS